MININKLNFAYNNDLILQDISIDIKEGDYVAIIGENGSGKSTLIKCLIGINKVKHDEIKIDGECITCYKKFYQIGYVSQNKGKMSELPITTFEYLNLISDDKDNILKKAKLMNITDILNEDINNLSGGQRQRVSICKSLLMDIKYLILDEPNTGLDKISRKNLYKLLSDLNKEGLTIIVVTHHLEEINNSINKVYNLETKKYEEING